MIVPKRLSVLRPLAAFLGLVALVGGTVALFTIDNSAGSLFVITVGVVSILVAVFGGRIELESFEILGARIKVREVVRSRLELAASADARGSDPRSAGLREQALTLQKLVGLYDLYEYIRRTQPASDRRTAALDELATRMQSAGREVPFDPAEVSAWFHQGNDALRVIALNLMLARPECRDVLAVLKTIDEPRSLFEQYYGLQLAQAMLPDLDGLERRLLADAIARAMRGRRFRRDAPLMALGHALLRELEE